MEQASAAILRMPPTAAALSEVLLRLTRAAPRSDPGGTIGTAAKCQRARAGFGRDTRAAMHAETDKLPETFSAAELPRLMSRLIEVLLTPASTITLPLTVMLLPPSTGESAAGEFDRSQRQALEIVDGCRRRRAREYQAIAVQGDSRGPVAGRVPVIVSAVARPGIGNRASLRCSRGSIRRDF